MAPAHKSENGSYFRNVFLPNYTSSFGVQIINYLVPLILIPYIVRVVGPERYGTLALATAICSLFFLITDYGYQFTAPRKIALLRDTPVELNRYFSILLSVKALLYLACFVFAVGITLISTYVQQYFLVYFFSFIAVAGDAFFPTYLFQGIEKIKYSLYFSALSKIFSAPAIFLLVKTQSDFYLIPALTGGFQILAAMGALIFARRRLGFFFVIPYFWEVMDQLRNGFKVFFSSAAVSVYTVSNTVILGFFASARIVGFYAAGEKIVRAVQGLLLPLTSTLFPRFSRLAAESPHIAMETLLRVMKIIMATMLPACIILFVFTKPLVLFFLGDRYLGSIEVVRILASVPFIIGMTNVFANFFLLGTGQEKLWSKIIISCSLISLAFTFLLVGFFRLQHLGLAFSIFLTELLVMILSGIAFLRRGGHILNVRGLQVKG